MVNISKEWDSEKKFDKDMPTWLKIVTMVLMFLAAFFGIKAYFSLFALCALFWFGTSIYPFFRFAGRIWSFLLFLAVVGFLAGIIMFTAGVVNISNRYDYLSGALEFRNPQKQEFYKSHIRFYERLRKIPGALENAYMSSFNKGYDKSERLSLLLMTPEQILAVIDSFNMEIFPGEYRAAVMEIRSAETELKKALLEKEKVLDDPEINAGKTVSEIRELKKLLVQHGNSIITITDRLDETALKYLFDEIPDEVKASD